LFFAISLLRIHYKNNFQATAKARALSGISDRDREAIGNDTTPKFHSRDIPDGDSKAMRREVKKASTC
jgi:hypothetical protein